MLKTKTAWLISVILSTGCAAAAQAPRTEPAAAPATTAADTITDASVRGHMTFLASDAMNGRGSGTRDEWIAAEYLGAQLLQWGLEPMGDDGGFVQHIGIERFETTTPPMLSAGEKTYTHGREVFVQSLGAPMVNGALWTFDPEGQVPAGAAVLMPEAPPRNYQTMVAGAAMVLLMETPQARSRWSAGARLPAPPPQLVGVPASAGAARRPSTIVLDKATYAAVASLPPGAPILIEAVVKPGPRTKTWNAVGRLPGSDPGAASDVILLSAHLDHVGARAPRDGSTSADTIYNGADDDASGTVAVLELAKALASGPRPKRTIVFAFFGSEEAGGFGSRFFADRPVVPLSQIVANLQFEMIGRPDSKVPAETLWLTGYERSTLGPELAKQGAKLVQDPHPEQNFFTRSDNIQFARRGVVAHTVSSFGLHKEYHQPSDEVRHVNVPHMTQAIRSMLAPIRWLANADFRPEWLPGMKP